MDTRLLCYTDPDLSPEARWLLLQWSRAEGLDQVLTCSLRDLYSRLGATARQSKPALELLKLHGYVIYETVRHGRGRPVSSHRVSLGFRHRLEKGEVPNTAHRPEIEALCCHAIASRASSKQDPHNLMAGEERANKLAPATYWLLAVLLAHAEAPGIIRGLSYGRLQAVTGMTTERVKSQLSKLKKLGVIARHQPGVLHSQGGARMRSVYVLNLAHSLLLGKDSSGLRVVFYSNGKPGKENFLSGFYEAAVRTSELAENYARILEKMEEACAPDESEIDPVFLWEHSRLRSRYANAYQKLLQDARSLLPPLKFLEPVTADILKIHRLSMGAILKAHVHSYAMMLLSNHWADLENERGRVHDPISAVMAAIQRDCSSLATVDDREGEHRSDGAFFTFIYALAHHVAVQLQHALKDVEKQQSDCDFAAAAFLMEPFYHRDSECWRLKVHFRLSDGVTYLNDALFLLPNVSLSLPEGLDVLASEEHA